MSLDEDLLNRLGIAFAKFDVTRERTRQEPWVLLGYLLACLLLWFPLSTSINAFPQTTAVP